MDCVFEIIHVFMISGDVEDSSDWFSELDWELYRIRSKLDWRIQTPSITGVVVLVPLVQGQEHPRLVVLHHVEADVDVRLIAVVDSSDGLVSVQFSRMNIELQVMIGELETWE